MDDPGNDNAPNRGRGAGEGARAGELVRRQDIKFSALFEAMQDARLSFADCRVYAALLSQPLYVRDGVTACRPSRARLAKDSRLHTLSITRSAKTLADCGYVEVVHGTGRSTSRYTFLRLARGNGAVTGSNSPAAEVTRRLPLKARNQAENADFCPRGNGAVTQCRKELSVPLARAAFDPAADSGHHEEEQGPDTTLQASGVSRNNLEKRSAPETAPTPPGPAAGLWTEGRKWLMKVCEIKHATASGFLGKFAKEAGGREKAWELLQQAMRDQPADPRSWLLAAAKNRRRPAGVVPKETRTAEQIDAANAAEARRFGYV